MCLGPLTITVVLTYRSPRLHDLMDIWRDNYMSESKQTFNDWIIQTNYALEGLGSLGMVQIFLELGLKVVLIDLNGLEEEQLN